MKLIAALVALSLAIILAGFLYDVFFAGIPYQDPKPEMQARWGFHKGVSRAIMLTGAIGFGLVSLTALAASLRRRLNRARV